MMDPKMMKSQMNMINNMSDEQLENMAKMSGMPMDAKSFRMMASMMQNMDDQQIQGMTQQAQKMAQSGKLPGNMANNPYFQQMNARNNANIPRNQPNVPIVEKPHPLEIELQDDLDIADNFKKIANKKFKLGKIDKAEIYYLKALEEILELKEKNQEKDLAPLNKRIVVLKLNLALVKQKEEKFGEMLKLCNESLDLNRENSTAHYRKGIALSSLGKDKEALRSLRNAKKFFKGDDKGLSSIKELLDKVRERCKENFDEDEEDGVIKEEIQETVMQNEPVNTVNGGRMGAMPPRGNFNQLPGGMPPMNDASMNMMKNMLDTPQGREMFRNMYKTQTGADISDAHLEGMKGMMTPENIEMAMKMQQNMGGQPFQNTHLPQQTQPVQQNIDNDPVIRQVNQNHNQTAQTAPQMPPQMPPQFGQNPGGGMPPNMPNMPTSFSSLMENSSMLEMAIGMMKTNPAMLRMNFEQLGSNHPAAGFIKGRTDEQLVTMITWLERLFKLVKFLWPALKLIYAWRKTLLILFVAWIVKKFFF